MMKAEEKFSPGLDGIVAAETKISFLDTVKGEIVIQGYDLIELSKQKVFRHCAPFIGGTPTE